MELPTTKEPFWAKIFDESQTANSAWQRTLPVSFTPLSPPASRLLFLHVHARGASKDTEPLSPPTPPNLKGREAIWWRPKHQCLYNDGEEHVTYSCSNSKRRFQRKTECRLGQTFLKLRPEPKSESSDVNLQECPARNVFFRRHPWAGISAQSNHSLRSTKTGRVGEEQIP